MGSIISAAERCVSSYCFMWFAKMDKSFYWYLIWFLFVFRENWRVCDWILIIFSYWMEVVHQYWFSLTLCVNLIWVAFWDLIKITRFKCFQVDKLRDDLVLGISQNWTYRNIKWVPTHTQITQGVHPASDHNKSRISFDFESNTNRPLKPNTIKPSGLAVN